MNYYTLTPHDILFFRDGRSTETGGGHGARWPEPSTIFDALHAALWRAFPEMQRDWEHDHRWGRSSRRQAKDAPRTQRFGSLKTVGLFPVWKDGRWLFPAPADVTPDLNHDQTLGGSADGESWRLVLQSPRGGTNLPAGFLKYLPTSQAAPCKDTVAPWWSRAAWQSYLSGQRPVRSELFQQSELYAEEWTTGIGMDPETQTQDGTRIYCAQYLRLKEEVRCGFAAALPMKRNRNADDIHECIGQLFRSTNSIIVGGQQRACHVEPLEDPRGACPFPVGPKIHGDLVKWVLLTPAIWPCIKNNGKHPGGWLPNWVDHTTGQVRLRHRSGKVFRTWSQEKQRTIRQAERDEPISANLVAACVPKPIPIVGWTERLHLLKDEPGWTQEGEAHGPRATHLAVPAGAVYYFQAEGKDDGERLANARKLADALNWHGATPGTEIKNRRSTLMGEKGFGLGVCGTWEFHPPGQTTTTKP